MSVLKKKSLKKGFQAVITLAALSFNVEPRLPCLSATFMIKLQLMCLKERCGFADQASFISCCDIWKSFQVFRAHYDRYTTTWHDFKTCYFDKFVIRRRNQTQCGKADEQSACQISYWNTPAVWPRCSLSGATLRSACISPSPWWRLSSLC